MVSRSEHIKFIEISELIKSKQKNQTQTSLTNNCLNYTDRIKTENLYIKCPRHCSLQPIYKLSTRCFPIPQYLVPFGCQSIFSPQIVKINVPIGTGQHLCAEVDVGTPKVGQKRVELVYIVVQDEAQSGARAGSACRLDTARLWLNLGPLLGLQIEQPHIEEETDSMP